MENNTLPEEVQNQIFQQAEDLYNLLDEKARDYDHYEYGLPMFDKCKQPIVDLLTVWATRYQGVVEDNDRLRKALEEIATTPAPSSYMDAWGVLKNMQAVGVQALAQKGGESK